MNFHTITCFNTVAQSLVIVGLSHSREPLFRLLQETDFHYFSMDRKGAMCWIHEIKKEFEL